MFHNGNVIASSPLCSLMETSLQSIETGEEVLDLGAGYGRVGKALEAINPSAKITSLEIDLELVSRGIEANSSLNFVHGSVNEIPFPDRSFDAVTAVNVFHEVACSSEPEKRLEEFGEAIKEVSRVLKLGGQLIMFDGVMPLDGSSGILVRSRTERAEELLRIFSTDYVARKPSLKFCEFGFAETDISTLVTLVTKFGYLLEGKAWEGERRQLYPFATIPEITSVLYENILTTDLIVNPDPEVRPGLGMLLDNYAISSLDGGVSYGVDNFPYCQALIRAMKI